MVNKLVLTLATSTILLTTLGLTLTAQATPRTRLIFPWSVTCTGRSVRRTGHLAKYCIAIKKYL